ncbi:glycosyltransferase family 2 protein [Microbacterium sp. STN6]|uniref:glycosyltransferase family 2 protein n=1 Tax=Microbacterium sp. STN6 TaxID=2995588 RepID=UPI002260BAA9|nr:glycosyltransferase family 2 protein [Microbacterium sp. STN6]MCX7521031.1 glycosyltransferase family 2 protein [Microbacterium sp. STN6]
MAVALCTHNGERYIGRQLASILKQSEQPVEIVVSDDASVDRTVEIVREIASAVPEGGPRITLLQNDSALGIAANFAQAMLATSAELVALCDQDDIWHEDKVRRAVDEFARSSETTLVHSNARLVDRNEMPLGTDLLHSLGVSRRERESIAAGNALYVFLRRNLVTGATATVCRRVVDLALPVPDGWLHDEWLAVVASAIGRVVLLDEQLIDYRQHGHNQIGAEKITMAGRFERIRERRTERNARLLERAHSLATRFSAGEPAVPERVLLEVDAKLAHEQKRSKLNHSRILRVGPVIVEWYLGRYSRYGRGWKDIARDLLQPE